jgi:hypothetical protein
MLKPPGIAGDRRSAVFRVHSDAPSTTRPPPAILEPNGVSRASERIAFPCGPPGAAASLRDAPRRLKADLARPKPRQEAAEPPASTQAKKR